MSARICRAVSDPDVAVLRSASSSLILLSATRRGGRDGCGQPECLSTCHATTALPALPNITLRSVQQSDHSSKTLARVSGSVCSSHTERSEMTDGDAVCFTPALCAFILQTKSVPRSISVREGKGHALDQGCLFFAIFAFSTCGGYSGVFRMSVECKNRSESDLNIEVEFGYPFRLHQVWFDAPTCKGPEPERLFLVGDNSSSAEFFVTIAVFSFLYSMAAASVYIFLLEKYREGSKGAQADFVVTAVFTFMWLICSAAWAKGLSDVKRATDPDDVINLIPACDREENRCKEIHEPVMSGLNTSVVGNLWFIFKETGWMAAFAGTYMPSAEKQPAPDSFGQGYGQEGFGQDPYSGSQGGYQPDYGQQDGYEGGGYNQNTYGQGEPTSFSNEISLLKPLSDPLARPAVSNGFKGKWGGGVQAHIFRIINNIINQFKKTMDPGGISRESPAKLEQVANAPALRRVAFPSSGSQRRNNRLQEKMAETDGSPLAGCLEKLKSYVRTRKGTILGAEILISFIILICYAASYYGGYTAVAICEMIFAIIFFVIYMMELDKQFLVVNWMWSDLFRAIIGAGLYLITSLICVIGGAGDGARIAGGDQFRKPLYGEFLPAVYPLFKSSPYLSLNRSLRIQQFFKKTLATNAMPNLLP
ncbi:hypothetical protein DNTS_023004 [Danionella cerebrum]|uniref:MARVEL domain-containing protein n=1 Tax=Danionella cerebrum TaxID=2873325 RepID=A0A553RBA8_9TELE|nr:hypothetical protein DNTS_023004 [Danionella translucida]